MNFDWIYYLELAETLDRNPDICGSPEACYRSAVSRAYYATYHLAITMAKREGYSPTSTGDYHKQIQRHFRDYRPIDQTHRKIAIDLDRLLDNRRQADYEQRIDKEAKILSSQSLSLAKYIIERLDSIKT